MPQHNKKFVKCRRNQKLRYPTGSSAGFRVDALFAQSIAEF